MRAGGDLPFDLMKLKHLKEELAARGSARSGLNEGGAAALLAQPVGRGVGGYARGGGQVLLIAPREFRA